MAAVRCIAQHVLSLLQSVQRRPLFVGIQGPQGSGKSYTAKLLHDHLASPPLNLRLAVLSIDDLYRPHAELRSLAISNPENRLWNVRGQPGTHDVDLGIRIFAHLREHKSVVELPRFDKSLYFGEGDRLPMGSGVIVEQPPSLDIVILEGWCVGFYPIPLGEIEKRWDHDWAKESAILDIAGLARMDNIAKINEKLCEYVKLWDFLDTLVQLEPMDKLSSEDRSKFSVVYKWRLEQEHFMKANNGGIGMSDDAVKAFVDRYIPGYVFFGASDAKWIGKCLKIILTEEREITRFYTF